MKQLIEGPRFVKEEMLRKKVNSGNTPNPLSNRVIDLFSFKRIKKPQIK